MGIEIQIQRTVETDRSDRLQLDLGTVQTACQMYYSITQFLLTLQHFKSERFQVRVTQEACQLFQ
jgi:hypothetical protein